MPVFLVGKCNLLRGDQMKTYGKSSLFVRAGKLIRKLILVRKGFILCNMSKGFEKELKAFIV